jgi:hypothetical protein
MIHEHDCIVLTQDIPDDDLKAGDVGTVVHIHRDAAAYEVEFMTLTGRTPRRRHGASRATAAGQLTRRKPRSRTGRHLDATQDGDAA